MVNRDDSVTINFFNIAKTEDEGKEEEGGGGGEAAEEGGGEAAEGRHSFTMDAQPYSVDIDTAAGELEMQPLQQIKKGSSNITASTILRL